MLDHNSKALKKRRQDLRCAMPQPEIELWKNIRAKHLGVKFRRQYSIGHFILDFYAPQIKLAIEIDGESHYENKQSELHDQERDRLLKKEGIQVLRFSNHEVMTNIDAVCETITILIPLAGACLPLVFPEPSAVGRDLLGGRRPTLLGDITKQENDNE